MYIDEMGNFQINCSRLDPNETMIFRYNITIKNNNKTVINDWSIIDYKWWAVYNGLYINNLIPIEIRSEINSGLELSPSKLIKIPYLAIVILLIILGAIVLVTHKPRK